MHGQLHCNWLQINRANKPTIIRHSTSHADRDIYNHTHTGQMLKRAADHESSSCSCSAPGKEETAARVKIEEEKAAVAPIKNWTIMAPRVVSEKPAMSLSSTMI